MSLTVGELTAYLDVDDKKFNAGLDAGERKFKGFGSTIGKLGPAIKLGLAGAAAGIGVAVVAGLKGSLTAASDLSESMSKANVVFGDSATAVQNWSKTSATAMGMSRQQALEAAGTFGNLFVSMGMADKTSAGMSQNLVGLAGDLASFNNIDPAEALDALRSGLTGETEPLKRLGVNMNEATLKAQAMKMGISDGTSVLTPAAKAQAAYALILEQTKTAQGDFARTSGGAANQQRIMAAQTENLKASIGKGLQPVWIALLKAMNKGIAWLTANWPAISKVIGTVVDAVKPILVDLGKTIGVIVGRIIAYWRLIAPVVKVVWKVVSTIIKTALKIISGIIRAVMAVIRGDWSAAWNALKGIVSAAWSGIKSAISAGISGALSLVAGLPGRIKSALGNLGSLLLSAGADLIRGLANGITGQLGALLGKVRDMAGSIARTVKKALGVDSPSKVFAEIGVNLMRGLVVGIGDGSGLVDRTLLGVSRNLTVNASPRLALAGGAGVAGSRSASAPPAVNVAVYLDSKPIAARVEMVRAQRTWRAGTVSPR